MPARRPRTPSSDGSPTSGSATSASASRSPPCPAASGSGSSSPPTWAQRAASTSSTSRPAGCTSPTSSSYSPCSTGWSTPASRASSSSTTRRSWRPPTGSSTSAPAPATTAAGSSSRAPPPTSSPPAPPSPASTSRPTSAPDPRPESPLLAGHLAGGDVEAVPDVDVRDREHQPGERLLVVVARGLVPDLVGDGVGPVGQARDRLGQRERRPLGLAEVRCLAPGRHREDPVVGLTELAQDVRVLDGAHAAAVDLA